MKYKYWFSKKLGLDMKEQDRLIHEIFNLVNSHIVGNDNSSKQDVMIENIARTVDKINKNVITSAKNQSQYQSQTDNNNNNGLLLKNFNLVKEIYYHIENNKTHVSSQVSTNDISAYLDKIFYKLNEINKPNDNSYVINRLNSIEEKLDAIVKTDNNAHLTSSYSNEKLQENYDNLQTQFVNLESEFNSLNENNKSLIQTHNDLVDNYNNLLEKVYNKNNDNTSQLNELQVQFNSSEDEKKNLEQKLFVLEQQYKKIMQENLELKNQLTQTSSKAQPQQTSVTKTTPTVASTNSDFNKFEILENQNIFRLNIENFAEFMNKILDLTVVEQAFSLYGIDDIYFKLLDKYKKYLIKCIGSIDLDDYIEDNLNEINDIIYSSFINTIIKPMASSKNNSIEQKCIKSINLYFEQMGYYTINEISVG